MKIVYTPALATKYGTNPVETPDRVRLAAMDLKDYDFIEPGAAGVDDLLKVHSARHLDRVRTRGMFEAASLAAGGAIAAAELACGGEPAFALIRPPGHHASADHAWGMCFFNNMAVAVRRILPVSRRVLILDIDLHFGDGTASIFRWTPEVSVVNIGAVDPHFDYLSMDSRGYLDQVARALEDHSYDLVAVSAGYDTYALDWGGLLSTRDFNDIGKMVRDASEQRCGGRRFAVLEGGYHEHLRHNIKSFIVGFQ